MKKTLVIANPRKLPVTRVNTPIVPNHGDEVFTSGVFFFNITAMLEWLESESLETVNVPVSIWPVTEKEEHNIEKADITRPIIVAEIAPDYRDFRPEIRVNDWIARGYCLIDGYHRVEKARRLGIDTLPAFVLRMEQHVPFLYKGYEEYVQYWNGKLEIRQEEAERLTKHGIVGRDSLKE